MGVAKGTRLGPYEVVSRIGAGGMGEVWRGRDTRLERSVAIKILPEEFSQNAQLRARFDREARTISQLNHPHICVLHDVGEAQIESSDGEEDPTVRVGAGGSRSSSVCHYLVMEMLEGESLADRLAKGPLPLHDVLRYGAQIAEALDQAHRAGVVHRDLKPGNVMITKSGAKLLDFGLAKSSPLAGVHSPSTVQDQEPTAHKPSKPLTQEGTILGTFQYMAPEQLEGLEADARTDIFALGCVLYEMSTGNRAFEGRTKTSLIAQIVGGEPRPLSEIQPLTPPLLEHLISRCLAKDPEDRWQSAHDIAQELRWIDVSGSSPNAAISTAGSRRRAVALTAAALLGGLVLGAAGHWALSRSDTSPTVPLQYVIEHGNMSASTPEISPDGRFIAYATEGSISVRDLSRLEPTNVPGTEGGSSPFWSPDGSWLGFSSEGKLWKVRRDGGGKTLLGPRAPGAAGSAVWREDGQIVFTTGGGGIYEVSDRGGDPRPILEPEEGEADFHELGVLPDGKGFLFPVHQGDHFDHIDLWDGTMRRTVVAIPGSTVSKPVYSASGHILFERGRQSDGLWAVPFSLEKLEATGEPFPVVPAGAYPSVAGTTLVHSTSVPPILSQLVEVDRSGRPLRTIGKPARGMYPSIALSPDGRRLVVPIWTQSGTDLWLFELDSEEATRLTFHEAAVARPSWSIDGSEVVYTLWSPDQIALKAVRIDRSGTRELGPGSGSVTFTNDGESMIYNLHSTGFNFDLWHKAVGEPGPGEPLLTDAGWELRPSLSPDGRYMAYDKGGDVLIRTYPEMGGPWQVATGDAAMPRWSPDGSRLYFISGHSMMEAAVTTTSTGVRVGAPQALFKFDPPPVDSSDVPGYTLGPDGDTFIFVRPLERQPGIVVIQNWTSLPEIR